MAASRSSQSSWTLYYVTNIRIMLKVRESRTSVKLAIEDLANDMSYMFDFCDLLDPKIIDMYV